MEAALSHRKANWTYLEEGNAFADTIFVHLLLLIKSDLNLKTST